MVTGPTEATKTEARLPSAPAPAPTAIRNATVAPYRGRLVVARPTLTDVGPTVALVGEVTLGPVLEVPALVLHLAVPVATTVAPVAGRPVPVVAVEGKTAQAMEAFEGLQGLPAMATDPEAPVRQGSATTTPTIAEEAATTGPTFVATTIVDAAPAEASGLPSAAAVLPVLAEAGAGPTRQVAQAVVPRPLGP